MLRGKIAEYTRGRKMSRARKQLKQAEKEASRVLEEVKEELREINSKVDRVVKMGERILQYLPEKEGINLEALDAVTLLSLPDHLRKTAMVLLELKEATASEIAGRTGRARAVESGYLNQLERMGFLEKKRRGRIVYFFTRT